jgi:hypothetical protein
VRVPSVRGWPGDVHVELAEVMPLTEVQRAQELSESGHARGNIILMVAP